MRFSILFSISVLGPITGLAYPTAESTVSNSNALDKRENLCSMKTPPVICQANSSVTVAETAARAYKFYRAFVVDGDPRTMFSLIDSTYKVCYDFIAVLPFLLHIFESLFPNQEPPIMLNSNTIKVTRTDQTLFGHFFAMGTR